MTDLARLAVLLFAALGVVLWVQGAVSTPFHLP